MMRLHLIAAACLATLAASPALATEEFTCPKSIEVAETPTAVTGWTGEAGKTTHDFRHVSFFDGDPKDMVDLAPDEQVTGKSLKQTWQLETEAGITVVCRYHDSAATFTAKLPTGIKSCMLTGEVDGQGQIIGTPLLACK
jgi:hypothetical protein